MSDKAIVYTYDDNGNLISMVAPDKSALYVYDANNRLIRATVQSGDNVVVEEYTYDFAGNRTSKATTTDGSVDFTKYLLDTNCGLTQVLAELNADGTEKAYYTRGTDLISQERDGKISYYLYDGHGSVRQLADENGNVTDTYDYDAFGNLTNSTGTTKNSYMYCGEQFDGTTGLYYLRARYMDPSTGTFISMDSYNGSINDPVSLHKYLYANANPVMYSDPSGYAVEGSMALALEGDEYALNRLAIEMSTSEMGYYSRTPGEVVRHVATVIAVGIAIITALTGIVIGISLWYEQIEKFISDILTGDGTPQTSTTDYRDDKVGNAVPYVPQVPWADEDDLPIGYSPDSGDNGDGNNPIGKSTTRLPDDELIPPVKRGDAPISKKDGKPVEIHHVDQNPNGPYVEMPYSDHRGKGNYTNNHPDYRNPSRIDRKKFNRDKQNYWKDEWDRGRWK